MALDETRDVPMLSRAVVVLQDEDVATRGGAGIALAATLMVGMRQSDLRARGLTLPDPPATLIPSEIETLADFLYAKVIGKGAMNRSSCIEFWGSEVDLCKDFPN